MLKCAYVYRNVNMARQQAPDIAENRKPSYQQIHAHEALFLKIGKALNIVAKIRAHLCPSDYPGLTRTLLVYIQMGICPNGLHNFAFYILNFDFPSHFPLMSLFADTYVPYNALYKRRAHSITIGESLQIALFLCKTNPISERPK